MIYELLQEFKSDVYKRFDQVEIRLNRLENDVYQIRSNLSSLQEDVSEIKQREGRIQIYFTSSWAIASTIIAIVVGTIVKVL